MIIPIIYRSGKAIEMVHLYQELFRLRLVYAGSRVQMWFPRDVPWDGEELHQLHNVALGGRALPPTRRFFRHSHLIVQEWKRVRIPPPMHPEVEEELPRGKRIWLSCGNRCVLLIRLQYIEEFRDGRRLLPGIYAHPVLYPNLVYTCDGMSVWIAPDLDLSGDEKHELTRIVRQGLPLPGDRVFSRHRRMIRQPWRRMAPPQYIPPVIERLFPPGTRTWLLCGGIPVLVIQSPEPDRS